MKSNKNKKSIAQKAMDSIRKPVPPPGHAHETAKDYRRKPKHSRGYDIFEDYDN
mgnify:CR=1 FL=1